MKHLTAALMATVVLLPGIAAAQIKTLPGESLTLSATIEAIEQSSRTVTLRGPQGNLVKIVAPADMRRFSELKVGDTITARYYENVVLRVKAPGEPAIDTTRDAVTAGSGQRPAGTASTQRAITATITAIDPKVPSISLSGPNNWSYSSKVADRAVLQQVKVGDRLDITWTEAVLVSFEAPKK